MHSAPSLDELWPMLLCERRTIPREAGWGFEIKYDGYRILATRPTTKIRPLCAAEHNFDCAAVHKAVSWSGAKSLQATSVD